MLDSHLGSPFNHNCMGSWQWSWFAVYLWPTIEWNPWVRFVSFQFNTAYSWHTLVWIIMLESHLCSPLSHNCMGSWQWSWLAIYLWPIIELHTRVRFFSFQFDTACIWYTLVWIIMLDRHLGSPLSHNCMGWWQWSWFAVYLWPIIELHPWVRFFSF